MRISAKATDGAAMDDAMKLTTADASAPAKATCHFMDHPLPSIERDPAAALWRDFEDRLSLIANRSRSFLLFLFASRLGSLPELNAHRARGAASRHARTAAKRGAIRNQRSRARRQEPTMARDFEDHCWKDVIDADTIAIYQAYRRQTYVGDNPAVLAIDLYNKAYQGGNRPVREVNRLHEGSCGENAWNAIEPTRALLAAARKAGLPVFYTTRHADTDGVRSTNRRMGAETEGLYHIKDELAPMPGELVVYKERASGFFGTPLIAHLRKVGADSLIIFG